VEEAQVQRDAVIASAVAIIVVATDADVVTASAIGVTAVEFAVAIVAFTAGVTAINFAVAIVAAIGERSNNGRGILCIVIRFKVVDDSPASAAAGLKPGGGAEGPVSGSVISGTAVVFASAAAAATTTAPVTATAVTAAATASVVTAAAYTDAATAAVMIAVMIVFPFTYTTAPLTIVQHGQNAVQVVGRGPEYGGQIRAAQVADLNQVVIVSQLLLLLVLMRFSQLGPAVVAPQRGDNCDGREALHL
jgi:hypothetical protein